MIVVLFGTELREDADRAEYGQTGARMDQLVREVDGFLGAKSYTAADGERITVARFASKDALEAWRTQPEHREAQRRGRENYYASYWVQVCETVRDYRFDWSAETEHSAAR